MTGVLLMFWGAPSAVAVLPATMELSRTTQKPPPASAAVEVFFVIVQWSAAA